MEPRWEVAEGANSWVVTLSAKQFDSLLAEFIELLKTCLGARSGPCDRAYRAINLKPSLSSVPVHRLENSNHKKTSEWRICSISLEQPIYFISSLTSGLEVGGYICVTTGGNGVRNSGSLVVILPRIVRAPYSSLSEATQHGTMLWASTWAQPKSKLKKHTSFDKKCRYTVIISFTW